VNDDPTTPTDDRAAGGAGYTDALDELETILAELEDGEVDIDRLAERVRRAAELLEQCRGRIDEARLEVTRVVVDLTPESSSDPS